MAIGAQVGGGALGTDTTSLVAFNRSIWDRIIPIKDAPTDDLASSEAKAKVDEVLSNLTTLYKFFGRLKAGWFDDADYDADKASEYTNALRDLINNLKALIASKSNNKAILPTTLSVEMDGIGGLIIGTIFKIPLDILPKGYKGKGNGGIGSNLGYIITGLGHTVGNGDWVTKIDAQTIILDAPVAEIGGFDYGNISININPATEQQAVQPQQSQQTNVKPTPEGKGNWETLNKTLKVLSTENWKEQRSNPNIIKAFKDTGNAQFTSDKIAWCAAFTGYALKTSGLSYLKTASSLAYQSYGNDIPINDRNQWRQWDIVVFKSSTPGQGHVGFLYGASADGKKLTILGGNQSDNLKLSTFNADNPKLKLFKIRRGNWTSPNNNLPLNTNDQSATTR